MDGGRCLAWASLRCRSYTLKHQRTELSLLVDKRLPPSQGACAPSGDPPGFRGRPVRWPVLGFHTHYLVTVAGTTRALTLQMVTVHPREGRGGAGRAGPWLAPVPRPPPPGPVEPSPAGFASYLRSTGKQGGKKDTCVCLGGKDSLPVGFSKFGFSALKGSSVSQGRAQNCYFHSANAASQSTGDARPPEGRARPRSQSPAAGQPPAGTVHSRGLGHPAPAGRPLASPARSYGHVKPMECVSH